MFKGGLVVGGEEQSGSGGEGEVTIRTLPMKRSLLILKVAKMVLRPATHFLHLINCVLLALVLEKSSSPS